MPKAADMRVVSTDTLPLIGSGGTCDVFSLDDGLALKAFHASMPEENVRAEYTRSCAAWRAGIPMAQPHELVRVSGEAHGLGIIFERLEGSTVAEEVEAGVLDPIDAARRLGEMLRGLHEVEVDPHELADQRAAFAGYSRMLSNPGVDLLRDDEAEGLARLFEALPDRTTFLHGDFHMNNVMHVAGGEDRLALIDLAGAGHGHPLLDWAGTFQACRLIPDYVDPTACKRFIGLGADKARSMLVPMMQSYYRTTDEATLSWQYRLMEALGYAKYACMLVREPNPWMDRQLVARQLREHVISRLGELEALL